jgi:calcium-independent phospholipase A2
VLLCLQVLCLDGGGIRGLVLIKFLQAIEKAADKPINQCFQWISGTSTGGILALAILHGEIIQFTRRSHSETLILVYFGSLASRKVELEECIFSRAVDLESRNVKLINAHNLSRFA